MLQLPALAKIKEIDVAHNGFVNAKTLLKLHTYELIHYICILFILIIINKNYNINLCVYSVYSL
jgi:hypothetical protein